MRHFFSAAIGCAMLVAAAPASAQYYPPRAAQNPRADQDIRWQLEEIYQTVERARRSRRFAEPEARALHREGQRLFDGYQYARRDGLDEGEYRDLDDGARALRERIDRRLRFGDWRDGRDDGFRNDRAWGEKGTDAAEDGDWGAADQRGYPWTDDVPRSDEDSRDEDWREDDWAGDDWRNEPVERPASRGEDWATAPSRGWDDSDDAADDRSSRQTPAEDWWLPPEERETIESRPGDRPPGG